MADQSKASAQGRPTAGGSGSSADAAEVRVKVRQTTKPNTWTLPHSVDAKMEFFHGKEGSTELPWEELHVVDATTKMLLAIYSRDQVIQFSTRTDSRAKSQSGVIVNVLAIN